jgi:hypothetical protein
MTWRGSLGYRFEVADRVLLHWQHVAAVGRPAHWTPLSFTEEEIPLLLARIEVARNSPYRGTEQMFDLDALAADLRAHMASKVGLPPSGTESAPEGQPGGKTALEADDGTFLVHRDDGTFLVHRDADHYDVPVATVVPGFAEAEKAEVEGDELTVVEGDPFPTA